MKNSDWYLYILECRDGSYYTGVTTNIPERLERHNSGKGAKYTRYRRPCRLVYFENPTAESTARQREYEIKKLKHYQKEELICRFSKTALKTILKKDES